MAGTRRSSSSASSSSAGRRSSACAWASSCSPRRRAPALTACPSPRSAGTRSRSPTPGAADPVVGPLAPSVELFEWHHYAAPLPPGAVELARTPACVQAFRIEGKPAWGLQFHAEVTRGEPVRLAGRVGGGGGGRDTDFDPERDPRRERTTHRGAERDGAATRGALPGRSRPKLGPCRVSRIGANATSISREAGPGPSVPVVGGGVGSRRRRGRCGAAGSAGVGAGPPAGSPVGASCPPAPVPSTGSPLSAFSSKNSTAAASAVSGATSSRTIRSPIA